MGAGPAACRPMPRSVPADAAQRAADAPQRAGRCRAACRPMPPAGRHHHPGGTVRARLRRAGAQGRAARDGPRLAGGLGSRWQSCRMGRIHDGRESMVGDCPVVFVSYSREDEEWRRRFAEMLKPLVRERRLEVWSDDRTWSAMSGGRSWRRRSAGRGRRCCWSALVPGVGFHHGAGAARPDRARGPAGPGAGAAVLVAGGGCWRGLQWAHDPGRDGPVAGSADPEGQIVAGVPGPE